jgi:hypothetical protein
MLWVVSEVVFAEPNAPKAVGKLVRGADPGFVDADNQDFHLREDSAVLKLPGWERIPIERIGLYKDEYRAN